jgi:hypothetical protein
MTWDLDIDLEEVRIKLEDTRIIRLALDSLEENLPPVLSSDGLVQGLVMLRENLAETERNELRKIGHREYMILAPMDHLQACGGNVAAAVRTLDELGFVIRLDG